MADIFQVMPGTRWLALLCRHFPNRYEHLVRYLGWYSNRARGERAKGHKTQAAPVPVPVPILFVQTSARPLRSSRCEARTWGMTRC